MSRIGNFDSSGHEWNSFSAHRRRYQHSDSLCDTSYSVIYCSNIICTQNFRSVYFPSVSFCRRTTNAVCAVHLPCIVCADDCRRYVPTPAAPTHLLHWKTRYTGKQRAPGKQQCVGVTAAGGGDPPSNGGGRARAEEISAAAVPCLPRGTGQPQPATRSPAVGVMMTSFALRLVTHLLQSIRADVITSPALYTVLLCSVLVSVHIGIVFVWNLRKLRILLAGIVWLPELHTIRLFLPCKTKLSCFFTVRPF